RLDELQAAILRVRLRHLDAAATRRGVVAARYRAGLATDTVEPPNVAATAEPSWHLFVVRSAHRDALQAHLADHGVESLIHYPIPPHRQRAYAGTTAAAAQLPASDRAAAEVLSLPMGPHLRPADVDVVIDAVHAFAPGAVSVVAA
ncbi:MAG: aminotransferase, partial [Solirubrobacteraceae bacterium]|nr:aminotransferase [Solirubrobacteraceae bacterium]